MYMYKYIYIYIYIYTSRSAGVTPTRTARRSASTPWRTAHCTATHLERDVESRLGPKRGFGLPPGELLKVPCAPK